MRIIKALIAFFQQLSKKPCLHPRAHLGKGSAYCPDCGYPVKLMWAQVKCRGCGGRHLPKRTLDGEARALDKYCRQCGCSETRLVKKAQIESHEVVYSIPMKEVDYSEHSVTPPHVPGRGGGQSEFVRAYREQIFGEPAHVVDGEVIASRMV